MRADVIYNVITAQKKDLPVFFNEKQPSRAVFLFLAAFFFHRLIASSISLIIAQKIACPSS